MSKRRKAKPPVTLAQFPDGLIPTPHAMERNVHRLERQEKGGPKVAVNKTASPLRTMAMRGILTQQMREAGEVFEATGRLAWGCSGQDILARAAAGSGGVVHETDTAALRVIQARKDLRRIEDRCSKAAWLRLLDVCVQQLYLGGISHHAEAYARLMEGLLVAADVLGIPMRRDD